MTIIVGARCSDGVVIGADSAATNAAGTTPVLRMGTDKLQLVADRVLFATTGSVGLSQRLRAIIEKQYDEKKIFGRETAVAASSILAREMIQDMQKTGVPHNQQQGFGFGALLAAEFKDGVELVEFSTVDFQPELKRGKLFFASLGSGQMLADPFLSFVCRVMWENKQPTVAVARFGIHWALKHTITCAPGFVGDPVKLGLVVKNAGHWQSRLQEDDELQEQSEFITEIESYLRKFKTGELGDGGAPPEPPPPPPQPIA